METTDQHRERTAVIVQARQRALLALLADPGPGGVLEALTSLLADLRAHPYTRAHPAIEDATGRTLNGQLTDPDDVREWIRGIR